MAGRIRLVAVALAAVLAACGGDGGELRDATRQRQEQQAAQMDSLKRDSAAAAQAASTDTAFAVPVFANVPDSAVAAPVVPPADTAAADTAKKAAPPTASAPPAGAPGDWTSGIFEARRPGVSGVLTGLRAARNAGFDRVTLVFDGSRVPGYHVEYARTPGMQCGSGAPVQVAGGGYLTVRLTGAQAHDAAGRATVTAREQRPGLPVIRELEITCDFEGELAVVVGVAQPNHFRVSELANPARLVIDVQQ